MDLRIDPDALATCVQCGLCLPHCPTYRVTGDEAASPRGRIDIMRMVQDRGLPVDEPVLRSIETCVQCRGCETACPSGVPFGQLMESTRETLATERAITPWWQRTGFRVLGHHRALLAGSSMLAVAQRLRLVPARLGLPRLPLRRAPHQASGEDVWLFTGCVMDAWQRPVHARVQSVLEATGVGVRPTDELAPCCGALHIHAGLGPEARELAARVIRDLDGDAPVIVDSAGCGAAMKDYGHLLGTPEAERFSRRVVDVHEWLASRLSDLPSAEPLALTVAIQDPCHLRHVQHQHHQVRTVLEPYVADIVELDDEGMCCGAGGAYSALEPELSGAVRARKLDAIARTGANVVASANPGCALHLAAAGLDVRHPVELVAQALGRP